MSHLLFFLVILSLSNRFLSSHALKILGSNQRLVLELLEGKVARGTRWLNRWSYGKEASWRTTRSKMVCGSTSSAERNGQGGGVRMKISSNGCDGVLVGASRRCESRCEAPRKLARWK